MCPRGTHCGLHIRTENLDDFTNKETSLHCARAQHGANQETKASHLDNFSARHICPKGVFKAGAQSNGDRARKLWSEVNGYQRGRC